MITNFLKLVKGKLIKTSVSGESIIPVGVPASNGQTAYTFNGIKIKDLASSLGFVGIPKPVLKFNNPQDNKDSVEIYQKPLLKASYLPGEQGENFKNYNPKYYIFVYRHASKVRKLDKNNQVYTKQKPSGYVHPTHSNGVNFPGNSPVYGGNTIYELKTEFDLVGSAYDYRLLDFDPVQFLSCKGNGNVKRQATPDDFIYNSGTKLQYAKVLDSDLKFSGKRKRARSLMMRVAIGIDNPSGDPKQPILFGDFSEPILLTYAVQRMDGMHGDKIYIKGLKYCMQLATAKRKIVNAS